MTDFLSLITPGVFVFAMCVTAMGGVVKGVVGFAIPLVMISGMGLVMEPQLVVACMVLPLLVTNGLQIARAGPAQIVDAWREHWRYISIVCVMIVIAAQFLRLIPTQAMFVVLGIPVIALCVLQLVGWRPRIQPSWRRPFEVMAGGLAGVLGGLAGTWGAPTVLYLLALETPRDKQMAVQGLIYGLGSVMLFLGHLQSGVLNAQTWPLSAALVVPAVLGIWTGFRIGDKINQERFRRVTLIVLLIAGANLIRRGLMG